MPLLGATRPHAATEINIVRQGVLAFKRIVRQHSVFRLVAAKACGAPCMIRVIPGNFRFIRSLFFGNSFPSESALDSGL